MPSDHFVRLHVCAHHGARICLCSRKEYIIWKMYCCLLFKVYRSSGEKSLCMCNLSGGSRISKRGQQSQEWSTYLLFFIIFAENCIKMKKIGLREGRGSLASLDPPLILYDSVNLTFIIIRTLSIDLG